MTFCLQPKLSAARVERVRRAIACETCAGMGYFVARTLGMTTVASAVGMANVICTACGGSKDAREAWATFAARGLIPFDWIESREREFWCERCAGEGVSFVHDNGDYDSCPACDIGSTPEPPMIEHAIALALDPEGIVRAEALGREFVARARAYGAPRAYGIAVWRVLAQAQIAPRWSSAGWSIAMRAALFATPDESGFADAIQDELRKIGRPDGEAVEKIVWEHAWVRAHERRWSGSAPNPWTPLREMHETGYALDWVTDKTLVLIAPRYA